LGKYADTAAGAIDDRTNLIVVAQSLAAFTASMLGDRIDIRVLVLVAP
jgi:hypothetical protein